MKCIACGSIGTRVYLDNRLLQCTECALVRAADRYFTSEPSEIYTDRYFHGPEFIGGKTEYVNYRREQKALTSNFRRRIQILRRLAPNAMRLVEIGSGYGYFLQLARRQWHVQGFEISAHAAQEAQRLDVPCVCGDYLLHDMGAYQPDIVCLWDTIEHFISPRRMLEKVASDLQPQGVIAISTGDIDAILPRLQGSHWRLIHPPTHLWYFSSATLTRLLREVGFRPVKVVHPFFYRSIRTCLGPLSRFLPQCVADLPIPIQTGDLMEVYAHKVG